MNAFGWKIELMDSRDANLGAAPRVGEWPRSRPQMAISPLQAGGLVPRLLSGVLIEPSKQKRSLCHFVKVTLLPFGHLSSICKEGMNFSNSGRGDFGFTQILQFIFEDLKDNCHFCIRLGNWDLEFWQQNHI